MTGKYKVLCERSKKELAKKRERRRRDCEAEAVRGAVESIRRVKRSVNRMRG